MTPSITENPDKSANVSKRDSQSSFSLSNDDMGASPRFLEESQVKQPINPKLDKASSLREIRNQMRSSLEKQKQIFNSVNQKNKISSSYANQDSTRTRNDPYLSKMDSNLSRNSSSKVEYRNFRRHEFFEERVKMQREKVRFMLEDDPESDRKVIFKNNQASVKVASINQSLRSKSPSCPKSTSKYLYGRRPTRWTSRRTLF